MCKNHTHTIQLVAQLCMHLLISTHTGCVSSQFRRERFKTELESYEKQLKEFETFGDLQEVGRYQKKAQAMKTRLEEALEKIEGFNAEEDAFDWDRSQYPLRNKLVNILDPYLKLYNTIIEFQDKHE